MSAVASIRGRWEMNDAQDPLAPGHSLLQVAIVRRRIQLERDVVLWRRQSYEALGDAEIVLNAANQRLADLVEQVVSYLKDKIVI
jgi:hypothetical protein